MITIIFFYLIGALVSTGTMIYTINKNKYHMDAIGFDKVDKRIMLAISFLVSWLRALAVLFFIFDKKKEEDTIDTLWRLKEALAIVRSGFKK